MKLNEERRRTLLSILRLRRGLKGDVRISSKELVAKFREAPYRWNVTGVDIRDAVHKLRLDGQPIGSDGDGYYYMTRSSEFDQTIDHMRGRFRSILEVFKKLEQGRDNLWKKENPLTLF